MVNLIGFDRSCSKLGSGTASLSKIEKVTRGTQIVGIILVVESSMVSHNRSVEMGMWREAESFDHVVHVGNESLNCSVHGFFELTSGLHGDNLVDQVPIGALVDKVKAVKVEGVLQKLLCACMLALLDLSNGSFYNCSLAKSFGNGLDLIRDFVHPDVEELLLLFHDLLGHQGLHHLHLGDFSVVDQVDKSLQGVDGLECGNLSLGALSQRREAVLVLHRVRHDVLDDFLHEDTVVAFSSHARVGSVDTLWDQRGR